MDTNYTNLVNLLNSKALEFKNRYPDLEPNYIAVYKDVYENLIKFFNENQPEERLTGIDDYQIMVFGEEEDASMVLINAALNDTTITYVVDIDA